jgi:hypothetical protein
MASVRARPPFRRWSCSWPQFTQTGRGRMFARRFSRLSVSLLSHLPHGTPHVHRSRPDRRQNQNQNTYGVYLARARAEPASTSPGPWHGGEERKGFLRMMVNENYCQVRRSRPGVPLPPLSTQHLYVRDTHGTKPTTTPFNVAAGGRGRRFAHLPILVIGRRGWSCSSPNTSNGTCGTARADR